MKHLFLAQTVKAGLPLVLGFVGGLAATFFPVYHTAFCSGVV